MRMANYIETADVLARWRDVERRLEQAEPGTPEAERLQAEAAGLRDEMRRATESRSHEPRTDASEAASA
jgi:hypothetical protein